MIFWEKATLAGLSGQIGIIFLNVEYNQGERKTRVARERSLKQSENQQWSRSTKETSRNEWKTEFEQCGDCCEATT